MGTRTQRQTLIVDEVTVNGTTDAALPQQYDGHPEAVLQTKIVGTATVQILGRLSPDFDFVELVAAATASAISPITYMPEIRVVITGISGGTVTVGALTG